MLATIKPIKVQIADLQRAILRLRTNKSELHEKIDRLSAEAEKLQIGSKSHWIT